MPNDGLDKNRTSPDSDLYATIMLSNMLNSEQDVTESIADEAVVVEKPLAEEEDYVINNDTIWVPADKHPEIAPNAFAEFIKTHGVDALSNRKSINLHRKKSILSQSVSVTDMHRTLSEKKRQFLKQMNENQKIPSSKSLSRRSAFSARGRTKKELVMATKRSISQRQSSSSESIKSNKSWDKSKGVSLYDQPVNMSEFIDLGNVSNEHNLLSRVQDAESFLLVEKEPVVAPVTPILVPKRPSIVRLENIMPAQKVTTPIKEKRSSWLSGLLNISTLFNKSPKKNNPTSVSRPLDKIVQPPVIQAITLNTNRLPLHVERAIYRLSHLKLTDPKRPLQQQVLISNLMFWYLSIQQQQHPIVEQQGVFIQPPTKPTTKMTKFIQNAKKSKNQVSQFVQSSQPNSFTSNKKSNNVQFNLTPIPIHHHPSLEDDDLPLSQLHRTK